MTNQPKLIGEYEVAREWLRQRPDLPNWLDAPEHLRRAAKTKARELITALDEARKAKGWVTVPEDPDDRMHDAGNLAGPPVEDFDQQYMWAVWHAMLAAAPQPTEEG